MRREQPETNRYRAHFLTNAWDHRRETQLLGARPSSTVIVSIQVYYPPRLINILPLLLLVIKIPPHLLVQGPPELSNLHTHSGKGHWPPSGVVTNDTPDSQEDRELTNVCKVLVDPQAKGII